ncbi:MAG: hypothetical protein RR419_08680 [Akkermansia sp.]
MIKFKTLNWWQGFSQSCPLIRAICDALGDRFVCIDATSDDVPDIVLASGFGHDPATHKCPHLFIQGENPIRWRHHANTFNLPQLGWIDDGNQSCNLPDWYCRYDELLNPGPICDRINRVCSMYRNLYPHREDMIAYHRAIRINETDKIKAIAKYAFNVAVENSYAPFYISEKLTDACVAGCIPIYKGGDLINTPFNQERIILPYHQLPSDPSEMLAMPILNDDASDMFAERKSKLQRFLVRVL